MDTVQALIDRARDRVASDAELARALHMPRQNLHDVRRGKRHLTDAQLGAVCDLLQLSGEEARMWLARLAIERAQDSSLATVMRRAFFALWALGAVFAPATTITNGAAERTGERIAAISLQLWTVDSLYIVAHWLRHRARTVRRLLRVCDPPLRGSPC